MWLEETVVFYLTHPFIPFRSFRQKGLECLEYAHQKKKEEEEEKKVLYLMFSSSFLSSKIRIHYQRSSQHIHTTLAYFNNISPSHSFPPSYTSPPYLVLYPSPP